MLKQLNIDPEKCIGCKSCELACSIFNDRKFLPARSRINTLTFIENNHDLPYNFVWTCRQCADAPCLESCPADAISYAEDGSRTVVIDEKLCTGCGKCVEACPFGTMFFDPEKKKAFKCELCGGTPCCVEFCPTEAIVFTQREAYYAQKMKSEIESYLFSKTRNIDTIRSMKKKVAPQAGGKNTVP